MSTDLFTAIQLITVLSIFCAAFCPMLCWAISTTMPGHTPPKLTSLSRSPQWGYPQF